MIITIVRVINISFININIIHFIGGATLRQADVSREKIVFVSSVRCFSGVARETRTF